MSITRKIAKKNKPNTLKIFLGGATAIVVTISAGAFAGLSIGNMNNLNNNPNNSSIKAINIFGTTQKLNFKDGTYTAEGKYDSPEGTVSMDVKITIKNNIIDSILISPKTGETSKEYQKQFGQDIGGTVIGKPLDSQFDLSLVNGVSLTGIGFRNAIEQIEKDAKI